MLLRSIPFSPASLRTAISSLKSSYLGLGAQGGALLGGVSLSSLLLAQPISAQPKPKAPVEVGAIAPDSEFMKLRTALIQRDFKVLLKRPPHSKAYGLIHPPSKTIWIHPITFRLGIARQTLIHEAVHAAQTCHNSTPLLPLGIDVPISKQARPHFLRYHKFRRHVEAEAFTVQGLPNGIDYAMELLKKHCV